MSKIRINELARQLEIPSHVIVEMLPEVGVTEKKTHSSSIDEPVAELVRKRVHGEGSGHPEGSGPATAVEEPEKIEEQPHAAAEPEQEPPVIAAKSALSHTVEAPAAPPSENGSTSTATEEPLRGKPAPVRPPLASGPSAPLHPPLRTGTPRTGRAPAWSDTFGTAPALAARNAATISINAGSSFALGSFYGASVGASRC